LEHCDLIYVSFDVDALDPLVSNGTGTPVENGLYFYEAKELLNTLVVYDKTICLEISEICPILDNKNSMGTIALNLLKSVCRVIDLKKIEYRIR
jgi:arginase